MSNKKRRRHADVGVGGSLHWENLSCAKMTRSSVLCKRDVKRSTTRQTSRGKGVEEISCPHDENVLIKLGSGSFTSCSMVLAVGLHFFCSTGVEVEQFEHTCYTHFYKLTQILCMFELAKNT
ncbi:unnamed protein product [Amoebophrya sp. A120]|nr:unnamed protein product [Amoebophrya sp. A120]|eukprot:GSA120T00008961001.1